MPKQTSIETLTYERPWEVEQRIWNLHGLPFFVSAVRGPGTVVGWQVDADGNYVGPEQTVTARFLRPL